MKHRIDLIKSLILSIILVTLVQCGGKPAVETGQELQVPSLRQPLTKIRIDVNEFGEGNEIRAAGLHLMDRPNGLIELFQAGQFNDSVLVITVHGYQSEGYEWITAIKHLAEHFGSLFFFRYDWDKCPDEVARELAQVINSSYGSGSYRRIVLFGHSYGGLVVTYVASRLKGDVEINIIAAPLSGFSGLLDPCESLQYDAQGKLKYSEWPKSVRVIQHRTVHGQDGAFRDLDNDPQEIDLPFYQIQKLPPTMDGHRLGHNWSVTWVIDQYVGKPHRY